MVLIRFVIMLKIAAVFADKYCEPVDSFSEIVKDYGFENYVVLTDDFYELKLFRVQRSKPFSKKRRTVLLMHGLLDSADSWALNDNRNMVQAMLEEDWDVWLSNNRGNKYSCDNKKINPLYKPFWLFSFQEMGKYDFPAIIKFITETVDDKVTIVGHSQGTTQVLASLSENIDLQKHIEQMLSAAPVAYMIGFDKDPSYYYYGATHNFLHVLMFLGYYSFFDHPIGSNYVMDKMIKFFCVKYKAVCDFIIGHISDKDPRNLDHHQIERFLKHFPSRASIQSMEHFAQMIAKKDPELRKFDYGKKKNLKLYGSEEPPAYDLRKISIPVYLYYGNNDLLSTEPNIRKLETTLRHQKTRFYQDWGHWSYFVAKEVDRFINDIINDIKEPPKQIL